MLKAFVLNDSFLTIKGSKTAAGAVLLLIEIFRLKHQNTKGD